MTEEEKKRMVDAIINGDKDKLVDDWTDDERQEERLGIKDDGE